VQSLARRLEMTRRRPKPRPDAPVPIALTITDLDVGGAERALTSLVTALDRRRWAPSVVNLSDEGELADTIRAAGVPVASLGLGRRRPGLAVARLARALRAIRPELIQSFLFHANVLTHLAAPLVGRPWVLGGLRVAEHQKRWHLMLDRLTARLGCGSVCVSEGVRKFSVEQGGLEPGRLTVIPNAVDPSRFDAAKPTPRAELGLADDVFLALTVGRLDVQKGLPDLLDAVELVGDGPTPWRLAIVGDGPLRGWLADQVAARPALTGRVVLLGRRDDVPSLMRSADLLVHAAHWEGMANVILEAMAAGLPVVSTAVEGAEELVAPGRTGRLVPPRDPSALAGALSEVLSDPESVRRFGRAGRLFVESEFATARMVDRYDRLWSGVLGIGGTPL